MAYTKDYYNNTTLAASHYSQVNGIQVLSAIRQTDYLHF